MNLSFANRLVQKRVELAMTSLIEIQRGDFSVMDETTLMVGGITNVVTIYKGQAHIHNVLGAGDIYIGENDINTRRVQVSIPMAAPIPRVDDLMYIVGDDDPDLPKRIFRVSDVNAGGLLNAYHGLTCLGYFESRRYGWS